MPSTGSLHIDSALTDVSVMYQNAEFVADKLFVPLPPVDKRSNKYFTYGLDNLRADIDTRAPGSEADEITWNLSTDQYYADGHALSQVIPDEWREDADAAIDLDVDTTTQLTEKIMLRKEVNAVTRITTDLTPVDLSASTYANAFDTDAADPAKLIDTGKETVQKKIGKKPNKLLLSRPVFRGLRNNLLIKNRISGAASLDASLITPKMLAAVLEVDEVIVAEAIKNTAAEGQTDSGSYVWGKYALLYYAPPSPGLRTVSLGYQFRWQRGRLGSLVYRFRLESRHSDKIEVMQYYDLKTVAAGAGILWSNATQN
jgi:hypothetical protein